MRRHVFCGGGGGRRSAGAGGGTAATFFRRAFLRLRTASWPLRSALLRRLALLFCAALLTPRSACTPRANAMRAPRVACLRASLTRARACLAVRCASASRLSSTAPLLPPVAGADAEAAAEAEARGEVAVVVWADERVRSGPEWVAARAETTSAVVKMCRSPAEATERAEEEVAVAAAEVGTGLVAESEVVKSAVGAAPEARVAVGAEEAALRRSFLCFLRAACACTERWRFGRAAVCC